MISCQLCRPWWLQIAMNQAMGAKPLWMTVCLVTFIEVAWVIGDKSSDSPTCRFWCRCRPTFANVGVGRHFVFKPTFFRLFETYENSKFPTFLMGFAWLTERCNHQFAYKNRVNPEMHQNSCFRTKISFLLYYSTEKKLKICKIYQHFMMSVWSRCRCRFCRHFKMSVSVSADIKIMESVNH